MDRPAEIDLLCRLCLVKDRVDIPIFEEQGDIRQIFLKISCCLPISISLEDSLPKKICDNCSIKLDSLYDFWNCTVNAEKTLLTWLGQAGVKDAGNTITAVAQQIAKPESQIVKVEDIPDLIDGGVVEDDEEEERPQKRARRSAAVKAQETIANVVGNEEDDEEPSAKKARSSVDEDDSDEDEASMKDNDDDDDDEGEDFEGIEPKMEDEGDESEGEVKPTFDAIPGTSAQDQPGPSGVGKIEADAPTSTLSKLEVVSESGQVYIFLQEEPLDIKEEPDEEKMPCDYCDKYYETNYELAFHVKLHHSNNKNERFKCDFCDKSFKRRVCRSEHIEEMHQLNDPYFKCDFCESFFKHEYQLQSHVENQHGKKIDKLKCNLCDKCFISKGSLHRHVKIIHSGNYKRCCYFCRTTFNHKQDFDIHVKMLHSETNLMFECDFCQEPFSDRKDLRNHVKELHSDKYVRIKCNLCGKSYKNLNEHVRLLHS